MVSDDVTALREHLAARLSEAALEKSPFAHVLLENVFPAAVYEAILRCNPFREQAGSEWLPHEQSANVSARTPYYARKQIDLTDGVPVSPADDRSPWPAIRSALLDDHWFARRVRERFEEYFSLRFGDLADAPDFYALLAQQLFVQRHEPGFALGAHTDLPTRIFTAIFSFADRDGAERYGTELLAPADRLVRCWGADHHLRDGFVVRKVAPYRPNAAFVFFKTRHTFHAVPEIDDGVPNQRYGMQYQLREPPDGLFTDLSAPDLMRFLPRGTGR